MKGVFLGTGTSQGVPVIACSCGVCKSPDSKDKRTRTSFMLEIDRNCNIVIDTGPDFREQMLREDVQDVHAVLFTHEHKDHVAGLDDIRAFNFKYKKDMDIYCTSQVEKALRNEFHYVFANFSYPGVPKLNINTINNSPFQVGGHQITPIKGLHYKLPVLGFRIQDFTYITDMNFINEEELQKIKGTKTLVINALRKEEHISHFTLDQALAIINKLDPESAYLTHLSHYMGKHEDVEEMLPKNVFVAYDGLKIDV